LARAIIGFTYYIVTGNKGGVPNLNSSSNNATDENKPYEAAQETNTIPDINTKLFDQ